MYLWLNYLLFGYTAFLAFSLKQRGERFRNGYLHMCSFSLAALLGGLCHQLDYYGRLVTSVFNDWNLILPAYLKLGSVEELYVRLWFLTLLSIGATEYYFMMLFFHRLAKKSIIRMVQALFALYSIACLFTLDYPLVIVFHVISHVTVITYSGWLLLKGGARELRWLIALCLFNLGLGLVWGAMGLSWLPSAGMHANDWYHLGLIVFAFFLHRILTQTEFLTRDWQA